MIITILALIPILIILAVPTYMWIKNIRSEEYFFQNFDKTDLPYITIDVQGQQLNMIVDSAAAMSIIKKDVISELSYEPSPRKITLAALSNEGGIDSETVILPITVNDTEIKTDFLVYDSDDIADFGRKFGVTIHGLLGVEFWKRTKGIIDFNKQSVTFP